MSPSTSVIVGRLRSAGCVFAEDEAALLIEAAGSPEELEAMVTARASGLPLEQVVGWAEFHGLRILVDPGVFVPRRRSEFLVETALALAGSPAAREISGPATTPGGAGTSCAVSGVITPLTAHENRVLPARQVIVDLCCGTGALGLAVTAALNGTGGSGAHGVATAAGLPSAELHAADLDPAAVACARRNVEPAGGRVYQGDLFAPLPASLGGRVGILICNAPYVPTTEIAFMPPEARDHEARMALDGGADGLAVLRRAAVQAPAWLAPGGTLLVETSERQADSMAQAMAAAGLAARVHGDDEMGATVVTGTAAWRRA
jgi:release factor glutamine methyltransferase